MHGAAPRNMKCQQSVLSAMLRPRNLTAHKQQHFAGINRSSPTHTKTSALEKPASKSPTPQPVSAQTDERQATGLVPFCHVPLSFQERDWTDNHPKHYKMVLIIKNQLQCLTMRQFSLDAKALKSFFLITKDNALSISTTESIPIPRCAAHFLKYTDHRHGGGQRRRIIYSTSSAADTQKGRQIKASSISQKQVISLTPSQDSHQLRTMFMLTYATLHATEEEQDLASGN